MMEVLVGYSVLGDISHSQGAIHDQLVKDESEAGNASEYMKGNLYALDVIVDCQSQVLV